MKKKGDRCDLCQTPLGLLNEGLDLLEGGLVAVSFGTFKYWCDDCLSDFERWKARAPELTFPGVAVLLQKEKHDKHQSNPERHGENSIPPPSAVSPSRTETDIKPQDNRCELCDEASPKQDYMPIFLERNLENTSIWCKPCVLDLRRWIERVEKRIYPGIELLLKKRQRHGEVKREKSTRVLVCGARRATIHKLRRVPVILASIFREEEVLLIKVIVSNWEGVKSVEK